MVTSTTVRRPVGDGWCVSIYPTVRCVSSTHTHTLPLESGGEVTLMGGEFLLAGSEADINVFYQEHNSACECVLGGFHTHSSTHL